MKKSKARQVPKVAVMAVVAVALVGGSFALAAGGIIPSPGTLAASITASITAAITGKPVVLIGRDGASPKGTIQQGYNEILAVFDISAKNTTNWATLNYMPTQFVITSSSVSPLSLSNITLYYDYCIPAGKTYGYGSKGGNCASEKFNAPSVTKNGSTYVVNFSNQIRIYPEASYSAITLSATPMYQYTKAATKVGSMDAKITVQIAGAEASADQCKWALVNPASKSYGYTNCVSSKAIVNIQSGSGNALTVTRPYGYGYRAAAAAKPTISSFTASPATIVSGKSSTLSWTATNAGNCSIYTITSANSSTGGTLLANNVGLKGVYGVAPKTTTIYQLYCSAGTSVSTGIASVSKNVVVTVSKAPLVATTTPIVPPPARPILYKTNSSQGAAQ